MVTLRNGAHDMGRKQKFQSRLLRENKCLGCYHKHILYHDIICVYLGEKMSHEKPITCCNGLALYPCLSSLPVPSIKVKEFQKVHNKN